MTSIVAVFICAIATSSAQAKNPVVGTVYTETNDTSDNEVIAFDRKKKGNLKLRERISTGGVGSTQSVGCGPGCPILDSQYAVVDDGLSHVFAVNAGSDTVTSFSEGRKGLKRKSHVSSGGDMPESLALNDDGDVLYVLNVNTANSNGTTGNINGYNVSERGKLTPIPGSSQPLANFSPPEGTPGGAATARGIDFDPRGRFLVVTELAGDTGAGPPGAINVFAVDPSTGVAGPATEYPSARPFPFGQRFNNNGHLIVPSIESPTANMDSPPTDGSVTTYRLSGTGAPTVTDTESTLGVLPCWVATTPNDLFAYVVNTGAGPPASISRFGVTNNGVLDFLGEKPSAEDFAETDAEVSDDGKYLYVLAPSVGNPSAPPSHIDEWRIKDNGGLRKIGETRAGADLGIGATGLAAI